MSTAITSSTSISLTLDSSPPPSGVFSSNNIIKSSFTEPPSNPNTPSRKSSKFRSVKDMLHLDDPIESEAPLDPKLTIPSPTGASKKLKRPSKVSSVLSKKSPNIPSPSISKTKTTLSAKDGKIKGKLTKSTVAIPEIGKTKTIDSFDVFAVPSSPNPTPPQQTLLETPPRETNIAVLEPYIPAKRTWTPVKENSQPDIIDLCTPDATNTTAFTSLLSIYKHEDVGGVPMSRVSSGGDSSEPLTKRRCLEFLDIPSLGKKQVSEPVLKAATESREETKVKAPAKPRKTKAKKLQTITGLAIAPYVTATEPAIEPAAAPTKKLAEAVKDDESTIVPEKPKRKRMTTAKKTPAKKKSSKKSPIPVPPSLLSPQSVRKRMDSQKFVFGTSSDLLLSNPPNDGWVLETSGRKLNTIQTHAKIHARASYDLDGFSDIDSDGLADAEPPMTDEPLVRTECTVDTTGWGIGDLEITKKVQPGTGSGGIGSKGLWAMASRGVAGRLLDVEVMDLVDEDDLESSQRILSQKSKNEVEVKKFEETSKTSKSLMKEKDKDVGTTKTKTTTNKEKLPKSERTQPPASVPAKDIEEKTKTKSEAAGTRSKSSDRPNFEGYTLVQLQTQIQKYGFKPVKSRKTMIEMLNNCWDSIEVNIAASQEVSSAQPPVLVEKVKAAAASKGKRKAKTEEDNADNTSVPKKRGRKPKAATIESVDDGTEPPKPKRARKSTTKLDTAKLFQTIAAAIKKQPKSATLENLSWWQRIMMDETIVLEEFTEWLVESGMRDSGVDDGIWAECGVCSEGTTGATADEKRVNAVKLWCEARSVSFIERR
ncbi:5'-flap endonuclease [Orbilia ellipsospora]|uniref:Structure-specific endonuclease subunit SLX4 n=1 Tax=Orbilia ellipsospora TaxID=2528407 RepID=A0AAV9XD26_9PEZI